ncbi:AidA/PixA family protein [Pseudomonas sp. TWP3-1]|uniref:AidA/PixA family protein n=1 Tax=Pseudomonas sp. TWP3-1 TaxID=2804631 RepID=UPI003CF204C1
MTSQPIPSPSSAVTNAQNVLLVIDAESVLTGYPDPSADAANPTSITDEFIFIITAANSKKIATNDSNVTLTVEIDRDLHFRSRSISLIAEHSVAVYNMTTDDSAVLSEPKLEVHQDLTVPAPDHTNPTVPASHRADDHFWVCTPKTFGTAQCALNFMLVNQQCEAVGYFRCQVAVELRPQR